MRWISSARCGVLFWNVLPVIEPDVIVEVPEPSNRKALAPVVSLTSLNVLPLTVNDDSVPDVLRSQKPLCAFALIEVLAIDTVPSTPTTLPLASPNCRPSSDVELPLLLTLARLSVKFVIGVGMDAVVAGVGDVEVAERDVAGAREHDAGARRVLDHAAGAVARRAAVTVDDEAAARAGGVDDDAVGGIRGPRRVARRDPQEVQVARTDTGVGDVERRGADGVDRVPGALHRDRSAAGGGKAGAGGGVDVQAAAGEVDRGARPGG